MTNHETFAYTPPSARQLLSDHGLPEDVIDGVLCLHAQELAATIRSHPGAIPYRPQLDEDGGFWWDLRDRDAAADLIDPTRAVPAAVSVPPPATRADDQAALRQRIAAAIRDAACPGDCGKTEEECAKERIQPFVWHHGRLAVVEGTPEMFADAVLAVLPEPADRAAALNRAADEVFALDYDAMVGEEGDENLGSMREAWDLGTVHATLLLRRLADEAQQPEPEAEPTAEEIARANVLALHQIGEQLAGIESWMWEHLADVRDAAKAQRPETPSAALARQSQETLIRRITDGPCVAGEQQNETPEAEVVHGCPPDGSGLTPCCGRTPFELPLTDRISSEAPVTCPGKEA